MSNDYVLLADDEPKLLSCLEDAFENTGFKTFCCNNGIEAWSKLTEFPEEVVACAIDLQMPPGPAGGRDLVKRIRRAFSKQLPLVIYSGAEQCRPAMRLRRRGQTHSLRRKRVQIA